MFLGLRLHGPGGSILWGYRPAIELRAWSISKQAKRQGGGWRLTAAMAHCDAFSARQKPLLFTAPRHKGMWAWPIVSLRVMGQHVIAELGQPEQ